MIVTYAKPSYEEFHSRDGRESAQRLTDITKVATSVEVSAQEGKSLLQLIHPITHIESVENACKERRTLAYLKTNEGTFLSACNSVAGSVLAAQQGNFMLTRPPGHHAKREASRGYCLFNNIAVATQYLRNRGERVCILDIDAHQGDGTEEIFQKDPHVLFCSTHREYGWPTPDSKKNKTEEIDPSINRTGVGNVFNFPLPIGSGDDIFLDWWSIFMNVIKKFNPTSIGISAGFDAHSSEAIFDDYANPNQIGRLNISEGGFYEFGKMIRLVSSARIFSVLEGGYHQKLPHCINSFVSGINGSSSDLQKTSKSPKSANEKYKRTLDYLMRRVQ